MTLEEAAFGRFTVLTGQVSRAGNGKMALTQANGETLEFDASPVDRFKVVDSSDLDLVVQLHVASEKLATAGVRPKPVFEGPRKDSIKNLIQDGKHPGPVPHWSRTPQTLRRAH